MKTVRSLVIGPAVALAITGLAAAPALAASTATSTPAPSSSSSDADKAPFQTTLKMDKIRPADIADKEKGLPFYGTGFTPNGEATVTVTGTEGTPYTVESKLKVNEEGRVSGFYFFTITGGGSVPQGTYTFVLKDEETGKSTSATTFEVTTEAPEWENPDKSTETTSPTPSESSSPTTTTSPSPSESSSPTATPSESSSPSTDPSASPSESTSPSTDPSASPSESTAPSTDPSASPSESTETPSESASPEAGATSEESEKTEESEQPAARAMAARVIIDPSEITSEDFADPDQGVTITVTDGKPGDEVTLKVEHQQGRVNAYEDTKTVGEDGTVVFSVRALGTPVLGEYAVTVSGDSIEDQGGNFTVVTNSSGGSSSGGSSSGGSSSSGSGSALPRTGSELTGIALGAGLLVVGAAAIVVSSRRAKAANGPADL